MAAPAGATMAFTRAASSPLAISDSLSTAPLRALATNQVRRGCSASAPLRPCRSRRPCVATTAQPPGASWLPSNWASSWASTRLAAGKSSARAPWATSCTAKPTRGARSHKARATGESPNTVRLASGSTGSMNNSSVPPEWQAMPNSSTSASCCSCVSCAGEMRMLRACPSLSAARTVLITAGCAQPPPIQPWIWPSAVTTALSPALAEVGAFTRSTVTSAKACWRVCKSWAVWSQAWGVMVRPSQCRWGLARARSAKLARG